MMHLWRELVVTITGLLVVSYGLEHKEQCSAVARTYAELGYPTIDVPSKAKSGKSLSICSKGYTCCTSEMETNFLAHSSTEFARRLTNVTDFTRTTFITATAQFNDFFLELLDTAQSELDTMFSIAYGLQYTQNKDVFNQLFEDFRAYYKGGDINLTNAMEKFFQDTFVRMFALQSPEYDLSDAYLRCVANHMDTLKPFGVTPHTLTKNVRQAFVATRTFVQGLAIGRNVALKMAQFEPTIACEEAYTKQSFCSLCQGLTSLRPCHEYCVNVMKGCLAYHAELESSWTKYIETMDSLAERLEGAGSFNIEVVITPLKDLISTAIMEYHGASKTISDKVFSDKVCGRPPPAGRRNKRGTKSRQRGSRPASLASQKGTLNSLVGGIRTKIGDVKTAWTDIPEAMCKGRVTANKGSSRCWNGEDEGRYRKRKIGNGLALNTQNPEVWVSTDTSNRLIEEQITELNKATKHMNNAKLGIDVDWLDFDISILPVSVSNSLSPDTPMGGGSGSYKPTTTTTTTTVAPKQNEPPKMEITFSGSSGDGNDYFPIDSEDGDVDDVMPIGSGWSSEIIKIAPFETPRSKPKRPNQQSGGGKDMQEGSGSIFSYGDRPIAVPFNPPPSTNNKPGFPKPNYIGTAEGSGQSFANFPFNYDDEEYYIPGAGNPIKPHKPNVIQAGSTGQNYADGETSTSSSVANINSPNICLFIVHSLFLIAYVVPGWVT